MNPTVILNLIRLRMSRVFREKSNLVWLFLMPMVFSLLMGQLMGDWDRSSNSDNRPRFMVYDQDQQQAADALLAPLMDHERFIVVQPDTVHSEEAVLAALEKNRITAALFIPEGYTQAVARHEPVELRLFYDSDRLSSQSVRTLLEEEIIQLNTKQVARDLASRPQNFGAKEFSAAAFSENWDNPRVTLKTETLGRLPDTGLKLTRSAQHLGPAYTIFFVMMFLMMSAKDMVTERQDRTLARLMVSEASSLDLVMGFFLGGMVIGLIQATLLLLLNMLPPFRVDYGDSLGGLILVVLLFAGVCSAGSVLLGTLARSGAQADGLGMAVTMIMAAVGGLWWPMEIVPAFMQDIGRSLPTGQAITIFHDMIGRGYGVGEMLPMYTGLAIWFVMLLMLGTWRLRRLVTT